MNTAVARNKKQIEDGHIQPKTSVKGLRRFARDGSAIWRSQAQGAIKCMSFGAKLLTTGTVCSAFQVATALCSTDKQPKTWNTGAGVEILHYGLLLPHRAIGVGSRRMR